MLMTQVITVSGKTSTRSKCRRISEKYYLIGDPTIEDSGDCYYIYSEEKKKSQYYIISKGAISWSASSNCYVIISEHPNLIQGYIGSSSRGLKKGLFEVNPLTTVYVGEIRNGGLSTITPAMSFEAIASNVNFHFEFGVYVRKSSNVSALPYRLSGDNLTMYPLFRSGVYSYAESELKDTLEETFRSTTPKINPRFEELAVLMNGITFGGEFETSRGRICQTELFKYGVLPLKDGSVGGVEYTTIPHEGAKGLHSIFELCKSLSVTCDVDKQTSLHYHLGNILQRKSKNEQSKFLIAMYMLYYHLQREIWAMLPAYKKDFKFHAGKNKDHCKDLPNLDFHGNTLHQSGSSKELSHHMSNLFRFANDGVLASNSSNRTNRTHCKQGARKWNIESRYYALNFYNAFFSDSNTLEFRAHSGTVNPEKSLSWLLICTALVRFAETRTSEILRAKAKYDLVDIVEEFRLNFGQFDKPTETSNYIATYLKEYIVSRKKSFTEALFNKDLINNEFSGDSNYSLKRSKKRTPSMLQFFK